MGARQRRLQGRDGRGAGRQQQRRARGGAPASAGQASALGQGGAQGKGQGRRQGTSGQRHLQIVPVLAAAKLLDRRLDRRQIPVQGCRLTPTQPTAWSLEPQQPALFALEHAPGCVQGLGQGQRERPPVQAEGGGGADRQLHHRPRARPSARPRPLSA